MTKVTAVFPIQMIHLFIAQPFMVNPFSYSVFNYVLFAYTI